MLLKRERVIAQQRVCCHADERWRSAAPGQHHIDSAGNDDNELEHARLHALDHFNTDQEFGPLQPAMLRAADGLQTQLSDLEHELERLSADLRGAVAPRTGMSEKGGGPP